MASRKSGGAFPEAMIFPSLLDHQQTFIILHGRGSTAQKFGPALLDTPTLSGEKLQAAFPHAKIIFLTASLNRATIYKRSYTHQWFDHWHMEEPTKHQDLMGPGLKKSCEYVHSVLEKEIEIIGSENVVLWGLSQGCATSLVSLLTWEGEPFAATIGMCGYLPYDNHIEEIARGDTSEDNNALEWQDYSDDNPFARPDEEDDDSFARSDDEDDDDASGTKDLSNGSSSKKRDLAREAVEFLKEEIDMDDSESVEMEFRKIPIFLGHGIEDEKVPIEHGRSAKVCLELLGAKVEMVKYEDLGHWYSAAMLEDIFHFLKEKLHIA